MSLIELALSWVINHPAVSAAIVGPRTIEHLDSQLPAAALTLDAAVLDRIDEIVAPGTTLNAADAGFVNPALEHGRPAAKLRRSAGQRLVSSVAGPGTAYSGVLTRTTGRRGRCVTGDPAVDLQVLGVARDPQIDQRRICPGTSSRRILSSSSLLAGV